VPPDEYLRSLLTAPHFVAVVALSEGAVIGGLAADELQKFERDRGGVENYDLAGVEDPPRQGGAARLLQELARIARHRRVYVIFVQADRGDAPAIALYEKLGTREDVHHFDIIPA